VLTNLCNGAHAAGLGSCWINRPQFMFETNEGRELLRRWGIEGDWVGVGSVALGYADGEIRAPKPRKENYCIIVR
jgi:nitroreductase